MALRGKKLNEKFKLDEAERKRLWSGKPQTGHLLSLFISLREHCGRMDEKNVRTGQLGGHLGITSQGLGSCLHRACLD